MSGRLCSLSETFRFHSILPLHFVSLFGSPLFFQFLSPPLSFFPPDSFFIHPLVPTLLFSSLFNRCALAKNVNNDDICGTLFQETHILKSFFLNVYLSPFFSPFAFCLARELLDNFQTRVLRLFLQSPTLFFIHFLLPLLLFPFILLRRPQSNTDEFQYEEITRLRNDLTV